MRLRWAVILIALLPLVLASMAAAWVVTQRSRVLADLHLAAVEPVLLAARRAELQSYINIARSSIAHLVRDGMPDASSQAQALAILKRLEFSHDGYFFVFDFDGRVLLYPRQPQLVGQQLLDWQDADGDFPVRQLVAQARSGGGYVDYAWRRPSTGQIEAKLGYVEPIAGWQWVLGTGTYVDEPERARRRMAAATHDAVADTLWRIGAITVLSTLLVVAAALLINLNEQRKADARLRAMSGQIVMAQEAERAHVARELHDGVSQELVSVKYAFESALARLRQGPAQTDTVQQNLAQGVDGLRRVLGDIRRISHDLRPALLDDLGLARALEHLGQDFAERTGIHLQMEGAATDHRPADAIATAIFRVAQEALANIERHARARHVQLNLHQRAGSLVLEIQDDGRGFDTARVMRSAQRGLGLTHMRERIESLGGRFWLSSGASGTYLQAAFPAEALSGW